MVKQDYIMRLIQQMIRAILKIVLKVDTPDEVQEELKEKEAYENLCNMIAEGNINEAENKLLEQIDVENEDTFELALLFYYKLNELDNDRLDACNFSREEVRDGILSIIKQFGYESISETFMGEER